MPSSATRRSSRRQAGRRSRGRSASMLQGCHAIGGRCRAELVHPCRHQAAGSRGGERIPCFHPLAHFLP